jgi:hypothetical protein
MNYFDVLSGLADGRMLICERWLSDSLRNRWLIHRACNEDFGWLQEGEQIRVMRATRTPKDWKNILRSVKKP